MADETIPYQYLNEYQRRFFEWAGISIDSLEEGRSHLTMLMSENHRGGGGTDAVNGGIAAYLFDGALGTAVQSTWDAGVVGQVTMTLTIQYLQPLLAKESVRASAEVTHRGRSAVYARAEICGDDGHPAMSAIGIFHLFRSRVP